MPQTFPVAPSPLRDMIAALPLPTLIIDPDERIIAINPAARVLFGRDVTDQVFANVLRHPALVEAVERGLRDPAPQQTSYQTTENGTDLVFDVHLQGIAATGLLLLTFQNVSEQALAGQMRRDFVANVSHELRTPLAALMGFIETLRGPARDDSAARDRFLGIMASEAERMNRLVGDLLSLSRVEAEERVRPTRQIDLRDVLRIALRNLAPLAADRRVSLRCAPGDSPVRVAGDADQLLQVFTNLVENAIKYGGPDQSVDISVERCARDPLLRGPAWQVTVADHGPGIDAIHIPRLTERFYRIDSHRSRAQGGTGLGLAIVKHILNRHRGRLKITSQPGNGAQFSVILPPAEGTF